MALPLGPGNNCERIFKIKAVTSYKPNAFDASNGFIPYKKNQAFYVLTHYPANVYFVSNQYAVPFGRNALCGFVHTQAFIVIDLYSADSTKVPPPSIESEPQPTQTQLPSPPKSPAAKTGTMHSLLEVSVDGYSVSNSNEVSFVLTVYVQSADANSVLATSVEHKYQAFAEFHQSLLSSASPQKVKSIPLFPPGRFSSWTSHKAFKEGLDALQSRLELYFRQIIDTGLADLLIGSLLPSGTTHNFASATLPSRSVQPNANTREALASETVHASPVSSIPVPPNHFRTSLQSTSTGSIAPNRKSTQTTSSRLSNQPMGTRTSFVTQDQQRGSYLGDSSNNNRSSVASDSFFSIGSRHGSIVSRASKRDSIYSRRGSSMVGISTSDLEVPVQAPKVVDGGAVTKEPPKPPMTQWGGGNPVKSGDDAENADSGNCTHNLSNCSRTSHGSNNNLQKKRTGLVDGLVDEVEGMNLSSAGSPSAPMSRTRRPSHGVPTRPSNSIPTRTSSKQSVGTESGTALNTAVDQKLLVKEVSAINAFFDEDADDEKNATITRRHEEKSSTLTRKHLMEKKTSSSSLVTEMGIVGRSSSLAWKS